MSTENKEPRKITMFEAGGFMIALTALAAGIFASTLAIQQKAEIKELKAAQAAPAATHQEGYTFKNKTEFDKAVIATLDGIVQDRQKQNLSKLSEKYELAAEHAPEGRKIYGNLNARFTLVEFSETECPFCARHHPTMKDLVDSSKGNINWEWKHLPLSSHNPTAMTQSIVGECVAEQKGNRMFWVYMDEVFKRTESGGRGVRNLPGLVEELGVDMGEIRKCAAGAEAKSIVEADLAEAQKLNVNGTPATFVVDNHTGKTELIAGAQPAASFAAAIKRLMQLAESEQTE